MSNVSALESQLSRKQEELKPILKKLNGLRPIKDEHKVLFETNYKNAQHLTAEIVELVEKIKVLKRF